jgi:hypothetical protein
MASTVPVPTKTDKSELSRPLSGNQTTAVRKSFFLLKSKLRISAFWTLHPVPSFQMTHFLAFFNKKAKLHELLSGVRDRTRSWAVNQPKLIRTWFSMAV